MATLQNDPNFQVILEYLEDSMINLKKDSASTREEVTLRWQQGAVQTLDQLTELVRNSREILHKFR